MLAYYFDIALRSFRRNKALTALMVVAIGLGVGACMTTLTVFHVLSGDPIPQKSDRLFYVQMDPRSKANYQPGAEPSVQMTRYDAEALLREKRGLRQAVMKGGRELLEPEGADQRPFLVDGRYTSADFFAMFEVPFAYGSGWDAAADAALAPVAVISKDLNDRLFNGADSRGKTLLVHGKPLQVIGVLKEWRPLPRFYDMFLNPFGSAEQLFVPFSTATQLKFITSGDSDCWSDAYGLDGRVLNAPCAWLQYWVELASAGQAADYRRYLVQYSDEQRRAGRFERPTNVRLRSVMEWLAFRKAVPSDVKLQLWLGFGFLLVCLVNTVGLLLAKCLRRSGEIGVRRALGASRRDIFQQFVVEAGTLGLAGGLLGLVLAVLGLWLVRLGPSSYAKLAQMDGTMLLTTLLLALAASVAAGLLPAWRACQVTPALQLKAQ